jgi:hypothetical protein
VDIGIVGRCSAASVYPLFWKLLLGHIRSLQPATRVGSNDVLNRARVSIFGTSVRWHRPCFESITG